MMCSGRLVEVHTIAWSALIAARNFLLIGHAGVSDEKTCLRSNPHPYLRVRCFAQGVSVDGYVPFYLSSGVLLIVFLAVNW
jgi:hypothetical protein